MPLPKAQDTQSLNTLYILRPTHVAEFCEKFGLTPRLSLLKVQVCQSLQTKPIWNGRMQLLFSVFVTKTVAYNQIFNSFSEIIYFAFPCHGMHLHFFRILFISVTSLDHPVGHFCTFGTKQNNFWFSDGNLKIFLYCFFFKIKHPPKKAMMSLCCYTDQCRYFSPWYSCQEIGAVLADINGNIPSSKWGHYLLTIAFHLFNREDDVGRYLTAHQP